MAKWLETDHHKRGDDPVNGDAKQDLKPDFPVLESFVESFEADFTQYWIHHDQESNSWEES